MTKPKKRVRTDVYLDILYEGLLHIRRAATEGDCRQCFLSAYHIHNLPAHVRSTDEKWHKFYLSVERADYVERCKNHKYLSNFYPLWKELEKLKS